MSKHSLLHFFILLLMFAGTPSVRAEAQAMTLAPEDEEVAPAVHALCGKRVALLGESPIHGFGEALKFKVKLVRRLIDECHYDALFVESGIYDFLDIEKKLHSGQDVAEATLSDALGGLWTNKEAQALVPFLREKVMLGSLKLGGLDDQIGAGSYASREMSSDLVQSLHGDERSRCLGVLQKHLHWEYTNDAPYGPSDKTQLIGCLDEIGEGLSQPGESKRPWAEEDKAMIDSLKRNLSRDFTEDDFTKSDQERKWVNDRDRSMYLNFEWLSSRLPKNSKIIVWAATVHTAKDLNAVAGFEGRLPLGSYIRRDFSDRAFSLGFSAYSGEYEFIHPPVKQLSRAPLASLEAQAFANRDFNVTFLPRKKLRKCGAVPGRLLGAGFSTARWDQVVDGLIVFRNERAPEWIHR